MHLPLFLSLLLSAPLAMAQALPPPGFLCCNMRADSSGWVSDSNYREAGVTLVPAGTPLKPVSYGRQRVKVEAPGRTLWLGNDYSRELSLEEFARRYVVSEDPQVRIATYSPKVRKAIAEGRVAVGMTKDQVLASVGYPITSENPTLDGPLWRYWLSSFAPYTVIWDGAGRVKAVETDPQTALQVVAQ